MGNCCNCKKKVLLDDKEEKEEKETGNKQQDDVSDDDNLKEDAYGKLVTWIIEMAGTDCTGNQLMDDMMDGENTILRNTGAESETSRSPNLSSQQASVDSTGSCSENYSMKSSFSHDSRSISTIPETRQLSRTQSEDYEAVRPKQRGVLLKQFSVACDTRTGPKALNADKSLDFGKQVELNKSLDIHKSSEMSKSIKSLKSASDLKDIEPDLKVKETELLKARYQTLMSKKTDENTLIKQSSEPDSLRNRLQSKQKLGQATKSFDNFLDVPKPYSPVYSRESSEESSASKKDYLSSSSKSFDSDSARFTTVSPRQKTKRTMSQKGQERKANYRMSLRDKPVKSFDNFMEPCGQSFKSSVSRQTTISVEDEDGVIIENIEQSELIPLRGMSMDSENTEKFDINFESSKNLKNKRTPLGILSRSVGNIKEKTSKLKTLVRRKSNSLMSVKSPENQEMSSVNAVSNEDVILNDTLLDGNISDILFAIDTLWPTKLQ